VITGAVAGPYLRSIFQRIAPNVNVVSTEKEDRVSHHARRHSELNLADMNETVIIPGRAMVHDQGRYCALRADGVYRIVRRGPEQTDSRWRDEHRPEARRGLGT